jgi:hypothetical protein
MEGWAVNYGFRSDKKESIKQCLPEEQLDGREESEREMSGVRQEETEGGHRVEPSRREGHREIVRQRDRELDHRK